MPVPVERGQVTAKRWSVRAVTAKTSPLWSPVRRAGAVSWPLTAGLGEGSRKRGWDEAGPSSQQVLTRGCWVLGAVRAQPAALGGGHTAALSSAAARWGRVWICTTWTWESLCLRQRGPGQTPALCALVHVFSPKRHGCAKEATLRPSRHVAQGASGRTGRGQDSWSHSVTQGPCAWPLRCPL